MQKKKEIKIIQNVLKINEVIIKKHESLWKMAREDAYLTGDGHEKKKLGLVLRSKYWEQTKKSMKL